MKDQKAKLTGEAKRRTVFIYLFIFFLSRYSEMNGFETNSKQIDSFYCLSLLIVFVESSSTFCENVK